MILTPAMLTALLTRDDVDLCYIQQALATVCAQRGDEADTFLDKILTTVPKKRAAIVRTLAAQVDGERLANPRPTDGRRTSNGQVHSRGVTPEAPGTRGQVAAKRAEASFNPYSLWLRYSDTCADMLSSLLGKRSRWGWCRRHHHARSFTTPTPTPTQKQEGKRARSSNLWHPPEKYESACAPRRAEAQSSQADVHHAERLTPLE
ncbi:hypothetical protein [Methylobacterium sp. GC_Met_2]|uniref:hypothetical protein n=1 Tax=Methylobacterium sp. GC_Met_2 TaxID=2937376 RepID=UPI00226B4CE2|nr:hypothetical protein [Methylobacterium sp. GC_Met_2]